MEMTITWVFYRNANKICVFGKIWQDAYNRAGLPGKIVDDFRPTAIRNLERAGVARSTAVKRTGHRTDLIYLRYDIVSEEDLREAVQKLNSLGDAGYTRGTIPGTVAYNCVQSEDSTKVGCAAG